MLAWYGLVHGLLDILTQGRPDFLDWTKSSTKLRDMVFIYLELLSDQLSRDAFRECVHQSLGPFNVLIFKIIHGEELATHLRNCTLFDLGDLTNRRQIQLHLPSNNVRFFPSASVPRSIIVLLRIRILYV